MHGPDVCHTRGGARVSTFMSGQEYRDDAISTYLTRPNEHLSRWETKPHRFVCSTLVVLNVRSLLELADPSAMFVGEGICDPDGFGWFLGGPGSRLV